MSAFDDALTEVGYTAPTTGIAFTGGTSPSAGGGPSAPTAAASASTNYAQLPSFTPYTAPTISAPSYNPGGYDVQTLGAPTAFTAPTAAQAAATPGYQFQLQQGLSALQNNAAAGGYLRSGGSLKNFNDYAQGVASTNYQNTFNNALTANTTNFGQNLQTANANNSANAQQYGLQSQAQQAAAQLALQSQIAQAQAQQAAWNNNANYGLQLGQFGNATQGQAFNQGLENNQNTWLQNYATSQLGLQATQ